MHVLPVPTGTSGNSVVSSCFSALLVKLDLGERGDLWKLGEYHFVKGRAESLCLGSDENGR